LTSYGIVISLCSKLWGLKKVLTFVNVFTVTC
jgi:hypothetical protein